MDFSLRCNSLKCRTKLDERAVVTTCSHIFCLQCSDSLGLTAPAGANRLCPACHMQLPNPDDVVSTQLNPTEDYKTSVLSGLNPSTIMECAGRGLSFWTYQSTQEIIYQEYLAKSLTDKYHNLSVQMDKIINDANSEIDGLNQKLTTLQVDQDKLKSENTNLVAAFREKSRKHQQTQELYDRLKRKEMTAATQSAAYQSVDEVLGSVASRHGQEQPSGIPVFSNMGRTQGQGQQYQFHGDVNSQEQGYGHEHNNSNGGNGDGKDRMMPPPPPRRPGGFGAPGFSSSQESMTTPSQHRTRLGPLNQSSANNNGPHFRNSNNMMINNSENQTPSQRQPFGNVSGNSFNRPNVSGYGMSAGLKVGRQQGSIARPGAAGQGRPANRFIHPLAQSHSQQYGESGGF